ncbi:MAG: CDP-alcohol phosphatidyltransferase family protein [Pseudomonadota bacterium]
MRRADIPNIISLLRAALVPPFLWLLLEERYGAALALFAVAGVSDALDGYLAKRYNWRTRLGSILDPLADKLLLVCAYLALGWLGQLPVWLVGIVVARDAVIVGGALAYHFKIRRFEASPSWLSKINTVAQILLIIVVLLAQGVLPLAGSVAGALMYTVLITTVLSGLGYVWTWGRRALRDRSKT